MFNDSIFTNFFTDPKKELLKVESYIAATLCMIEFPAMDVVMATGLPVQNCVVKNLCKPKPSGIVGGAILETCLCSLV